MAISKTLLDKKLLQTLEPFAGLGYDKLDELVSKAALEDFPAGKILFKQGESDKRTLFLINGQVDLLETGVPKPRIIKAKSTEARQALAQTLPRPCSARTRTDATILSIDSDLLEILLDDNPSGTYEVDELGGDDSGYWMTRFLQSRAFLQLPTENIQTLLMAMEEVPVSKGDIIIHQGEIDNYYYIVQTGKCSVSRRPSPNAEELQLAILEEGDGFGEEALIMNGKRNASITMLEDGQLMRLSKKDFMTYLAGPLIKYTDEKDVLQSISKGSLLIDVRTHEEYHATHVEGSVNIPLSMLRLKLEGMNPTRDYILCCTDGTRSSAAAFLLTQHGLTCHVLKGGLESANIKIPDANLSVSVSPIDNKKVQAANHNKKLAQEKADKIQQQAKHASDEASLLARRVAEAEAAQRKAEQEVARLQQEELIQRDKAIRSEKMRAEKDAQIAKQAEEAAARLKLEAKAISDRTNEELRKVKEEAERLAKHQKSLDEALIRSQQISAEAEKMAAQARQQAEKEAIEIRRQAEEEAQQLRAEMEETTRKILANAKKTSQEEELKRRVAMDAVRQKEKEAEQLRQQAQHEAEALRQQAEVERARLLEEAETRRNAEIEAAKNKAAKEAEEIRRQAQAEAENLRAELLSAQKAFENTITNAKQEEQLQRQRMLEEAQLHAQEFINQTTLKAEQDAEEIRNRAEQEAIQLRQELEQTRKQIEESQASVSEAERVRRETLLEETRKQAHELLLQNAQRASQEAEQIRQQALAEANQLRIELTNARKQIEETVSQSHVVSGQQRENIINAAQKHAQDVINEATRKAEIKAQAIRLQAQKEADELRMELEKTRMQLAEQAARVQIDQQLQQKNQQQAQQQRQAKTAAQKQEQARKMAAQIRAKLEHAEAQRQEQEAQVTGAGMSLSEVKVKRAHDRIILEGAEDIFIFKEPSAKDEHIPTLNETTRHGVNETGNELPSFEIEGDDTPVATPFNSKEYEKARFERDATIAMAKNSRRKHMFTIAASLVITVAAGAAFLVYKPQLEQQFTAITPQEPQLTSKASINPVEDLKEVIEIPSKLSIKAEESKLRQQAEETFNTLVNKWKDLAAGNVSEPATTQNVTADENTATENKNNP